MIRFMCADHDKPAEDKLNLCGDALADYKTLGPYSQETTFSTLPLIQTTQARLNVLYNQMHASNALTPGLMGSIGVILQDLFKFQDTAFLCKPLQRRQPHKMSLHLHQDYSTKPNSYPAKVVQKFLTAEFMVRCEEFDALKFSRKRNTPDTPREEYRPHRHRRAY